MKLRGLFKGALLLTLASLMVAALAVVGLLGFIYYNSQGGQNWDAPLQQLSQTLTCEEGDYTFSGEELLGEDRWAMLLSEEGQVVWSCRKPEELPDQYTLTDVASFTRWYLRDYPVLCWVRQDGLLVVGSPKGSIWKHDIAMETPVLLQTPLWFLGFFLLALGSVLGVGWLASRHWFGQLQQTRDAARSHWIHGVSHDIRTPLSVVMGYAAQLEEDPALGPEARRRAGAIRAQSQVIRDLVNDLNLTMRLDWEMQPLRRELVQPAAFVRQTAADFLNGGMAQGFEVEIDLPSTPLPSIQGDPFLLRRALNNLLTNCVRHNAPGCPIRLGAGARQGQLVLWVEGGVLSRHESPPDGPALEEDGGAAHGTGLRLVAQIAAAHGGRAVFRAGAPYRCEIWLPLARQ